MTGISIYAPIIKELADWASDQVNDLSCHEIQINFSKGEVELYNYESGIVISRRPLSYFDME